MPNDEILEEQTTNDSSTDDTSTAMIIPEDYLRVYGKLLLLMVELGESMLHDCKSLCNAKNMPIVECYHMFKAAVAARQLAAATSTEDANNENNSNNYYIKLANTLINYVNTQLDCVTENYKDVISIGSDFNPDDLVTWLLPINGSDTQTIIVPSDSDEDEESGKCKCIEKTQIFGEVITDVNLGAEYGVSQQVIEAHKCWIVLDNNEFVPHTTELYVNGVRYFEDYDDDYYELIKENDAGDYVGVGIILKEGCFDITPNEDEIYVFGELVDKTHETIK